ncbi:dolichol kinase [Calliphora vicina]|uniref:dolichol kinase n=1 Tax=Calliphora vicina TaxID=7373 RepID=UPI00325C337A
MRIRHSEGSSNYSTTDTSSSDEDAQLKKLHARMCGIGHQKYNDIVPRPRASPGYWLCCLLPLALVVGHYTTIRNQTQCPDMPVNYKIVTIISVALCIQTISFFVYLNLQAKLYKWLIVFIPFICGTGIFKVFLNESWTWSLLWTLAATIFYQRCYILVMRYMPMSFTYGEASILVQGILLFAINCMLILNGWLCENAHHVFGDLANLNVIMMFALLWLLVVCILLAVFKCLRQPLLFYPLMAIFALGATLSPVTKPLPIVFLFKFIFRDSKRLYIILFYLGLVAATIFVISWQLRRNTKQASTRVRKMFHLLVVLVYVPGLLYECAFLYIASGVALALMAIFDLLRILRMPPFASILESAFHSFADEKDAGVIAFTPFCLLIGCSMPMWILPCPCYRNDYGLNPKLLPLFSGILTVGFGDTAASVIGSKFGHTKWRNSSRTFEGSLAYIVAILTPVVLLCLLDLMALTSVQSLILILATIITCLVEARTDQVDNLVLPLVFYIIVSLV